MVISPTLYTEKLLGWNAEEWPLYLGWSFCIFFAMAAALFGVRNYSRHLRRHIANSTVAILCCVCLPATIALYFLAGRLSMQPRAAGLQSMDDYGCCSQGLIFPREIFADAVEALRDATDERYYADMTLERWGKAQHLTRFAMVPPLLQHVGSQSSKGYEFDKGAQSIWNFEFEKR